LFIDILIVGVIDRIELKIQETGSDKVSLRVT